MITQRFLNTIQPVFGRGSSMNVEGVDSNAWRVGDWAIYRKSKRSTHPGRRATEVKANPKGDTYAYVVDKFWVVVDVRSDGALVLETSRGKQHQLHPDDPNLVRPGLLARVRWGQRFRQIESRKAGDAVATS